jgi:TPR repeat protein
VEANNNDASVMVMLAKFYSQGMGGLQQDHRLRQRNYTLGQQSLGPVRRTIYWLAFIVNGVIGMKTKLHLEAAARAGHEVARNNLGSMEGNSGNMERALKHLTIAASAWVL